MLSVGLGTRPSTYPIEEGDQPHDGGGSGAYGIIVGKIIERILIDDDGYLWYVSPWGDGLYML